MANETIESARTRALRIGVLQGGRLVEERVVRESGEVSFGPSARASFIVPLARSVTLFRVSGGRASLDVQALGDGRVALGDGRQPMTARELRELGGPRMMPLGDGARGRLTLGDVTVLFQCVQVAPAPARPRLPASMRTPALARLDGVMAAIVGASLIAHTAFVVYLRGVDIEKPRIDEVPIRQAGVFRVPNVLSGPPHNVPIRQQAAPVAGARHVATRTPPSHAPTPPAATETTGERRARLAAEMKQRVLALVSSRGDSGTESVVDRLTRSRPGGDDDTAFQGIAPVAVASVDPGMRVKDGSSRPDIARIGDLRVTGLAVVDTGDKTHEVDAVYRGRTKTLPPTVPRTARCDASSLAAAVRAQLGSVTACYERALRHDRTLAGKLVLRMHVSASGAISGADVEEDTLADPSVGECAIARANTWSFPRLDCGEVDVSYPFVFVPAHP